MIKHLIETMVYRLVWLEGKRRYVMALVLGLLATLALPPVYALPVLFISCMGLFWLIYASETGKQVFYIGWWFGFGHFSSGIYWIAYALLTDAARFGWMVPFAVFGLSGILAVYFGGMALCAYRAPVQKDISKVLLFAVLWVVMEWLRAYLFTGFPWNLIGYVWTVSDTMLQMASVTGIYGLSFLTVLVATVPVLWLRINKEKQEVTFRKSMAVWVVFLIAGLVWGGGFWRLSGREVTAVPGVRLRLVQANIQQYHKWKPELREATVQKYVSLTQAPGYESRTHIIWPETALPYFLEEAPWAETLLGRLAPRKGALITGALRTDFISNEDYHIWNSMFAIVRGGKVIDYFDKFHLVPFGEYVPFRTILPLEKITEGGKDFSTGVGPRVLNVPNIPPFGPLICYEAIFPQDSFHKGAKPQWLLNITNDAWFGMSSGPHQHFEMARTRAVEQGVPLVRVANTGISAVVDGYGAIQSELGLGVTGVIDTTLPTALVDNTIYSRLGDYIILVMIAFLCSALFFIERIQKI